MEESGGDLKGHRPFCLAALGQGTRREALRSHQTGGQSAMRQVARVPDRWPECQTVGQSARQVARVPTTGEAIMTSFPVVGTLANGPVLPSDTIISRPEHVLPPPLSVAMC